MIWLVGEPGIGKTTLARRLLGPSEIELVDRPKWTRTRHTYAAGHYTGQTFDGADTLSYSGGAAALEWWAAAPARPLTLLDGDRLSTGNAVTFVRALPNVWPLCVYLAAPEGVAAGRRSLRGSNQNPTWLKGRATKSARFYESFPGKVLRLDAMAAPAELCRVVLSVVLAGDR